MSKRHLHKRDEELFLLVSEMLKYYAAKFELPLTEVRPLPKDECETLFGKCSKHGVLSIRVRSSTNGKWDKHPDLPYQIIDTMSHELAHLVYQEHSLEWFRVHARITRRMSEGHFFSSLSEYVKETKNQ